MEEELIDYLGDLIDSTPIWTDDAPQHLAKHSPVNPHEPDDQVGLYITEMEDDVSSLKKLGFSQPTSAAVTGFDFNLHNY